MICSRHLIHKFSKKCFSFYNKYWTCSLTLFVVPLRSYIFYFKECNAEHSAAASKNIKPTLLSPVKPRNRKSPKQKSMEEDKLIESPPPSSSSSKAETRPCLLDEVVTGNRDPSSALSATRKRKRLAMVSAHISSEKTSPIVVKRKRTPLPSRAANAKTSPVPSSRTIVALETYRRSAGAVALTAPSLLFYVTIIFSYNLFSCHQVKDSRRWKRRRVRLPLDLGV